MCYGTAEKSITSFIHSFIHLCQAARPIETVNTTHKIKHKNKKNIKHTEKAQE